MADTEETPQDISDNFEIFPQQMLLIRDVFSFDFSEAKKVVEKFGCNADLFVVLEQVKDFIARSELPQVESEEVVQLMSEEEEVISFSQTTRSSVIGL